jgi:hypothetical protein
MNCVSCALSADGLTAENKALRARNAKLEVPEHDYRCVKYPQPILGEPRNFIRIRLLRFAFDIGLRDAKRFMANKIPLRMDEDLAWKLDMYGFRLEIVS